MKYLAFDIGTKHTGVAISEEGILARGVKTIFTSEPEELIKELKKEIHVVQPDEVVVGLPESGPARDYIEKIANALVENEVKVSFTNEDFTSRDATRTLVESGAKLHDRRSREHEVAAAAILQSFLDQLK